MKIADIRRQNLRSLIEIHGATKLATMLGYRAPSFLSQMAGPNPTRDITESTARSFEERLGLEKESLDVMQVDPSAAAPATPASTADIDLVADIIRMVGKICADEQVELPNMKFADVVALAYVDTMEHSATPRPDHIKQIVRLLK